MSQGPGRRDFLKMTAQNKRYGQVHESKGRDAALRRPRGRLKSPAQSCSKIEQS